MIICRKCQRHHPDDVGRGPCECGADLSRDGISIGAAPMASASVFDEPAPLDPFATAPEPAPPAPDTAQARPATAPTPVAPAPARADAAVTASPPVVAEEARTDLPSPPSPVEPVRPDLPPPPSEPKRRARSFNPADLPAADPDPPVVDEPTLPIAETVETVETSEPSRRARGVTPDEVLAAQMETDAANVGVIPDDADADQGDGPAPADAVTQPIATTREPGPGEFACPTCREPNADTRRFCFNCGTGLPTRDTDEELAPMTGPARRSLLSRLPGGKLLKGEARTFRAKAKSAGGGQFRYAKGLSPKAKIRLAMMVLGGGGAAMMLLGPYQGHVHRFLNRGPAGASPESAEIVDSVEFPNYPAGHAVDGKSETGFAFFWDPDGEFAELTLAEATDEPVEPAEGEEPAGEGEAPEDAETPPEDPASPADAARPPGTLVLHLEEATTVNKLYIAGGLPDSETEGPLLLRPSRINVCGEEACQELELDNSTSLKKYKVNLGEVLVIRITPLDVHETDTVTYPLAVIGEIRVDD